MESFVKKGKGDGNCNILENVKPGEKKMQRKKKLSQNKLDTQIIKK